MPEYERPTSDFVTSTLSGAIAAGDATATIGAGLDLPATNGILQIDYDSVIAVGLDDGPETISYATYTSATGALAGMTRGLNGTTGVAHANGAKVQCGFSVSYFGSGLIKNDDLETTAGEPGGAWKSWTPTWANLTLGNGTQIAKYIQIGKTIHFRLKVTLGSTSSVGTAPTVTLPVNMVAGSLLAIPTLIRDATGTYYSGTSFADASDSKIFCRYDNAGVPTSWSATAPFTWASTDYFEINGVYEAA